MPRIVLLLSGDTSHCAAALRKDEGLGKDAAKAVGASGEEQTRRRHYERPTRPGDVWFVVCMMHSDKGLSEDLMRMIHAMVMKGGSEQEGLRSYMDRRDREEAARIAVGAERHVPTWKLWGCRSFLEYLARLRAEHRRDAALRKDEEGVANAFFSRLVVKPFGVLGKQQVLSGSIAYWQDTAPTVHEVLVDPAGLDYIQTKGPNGAGGASGALYEHFQIGDLTEFPEHVRDEVKAPGDAKFHCYTKIHPVIHAVGPGLRIVTYTLRRIELLEESIRASSSAAAAERTAIDASTAAVKRRMTIA